MEIIPSTEATEAWMGAQRVEASPGRGSAPQATSRAQIKGWDRRMKTNGKSGSGGSGRLTMSAGAVAGQIQNDPPRMSLESGIWAAWVLREPV